MAADFLDCSEVTFFAKKIITNYLHTLEDYLYIKTQN